MYCLAPDLVKSSSRLQMTLLYHPYLQPMPLHSDFLLHHQQNPSQSSSSPIWNRTPIQNPNPLSLSLSLTQLKKKKNKSKHCLNEKPRAVRTVQNNAVRKTNRKSQIPVSKNEKFYQLRGIPAKRSEKWIGTEPRPENGAVSWKNESDSWGNSVKENRNLSRETKMAAKKKKV